MTAIWKWLLSDGRENSDGEDESEPWNMTVKHASSPYITDLQHAPQQPQQTQQQQQQQQQQQHNGTDIDNRLEVCMCVFICDIAVACVPLVQYCTCNLFVYMYIAPHKNRVSLLCFFMTTN